VIGEHVKLGSVNLRERRLYFLIQIISIYIYIRMEGIITESHRHRSHIIEQYLSYGWKSNGVSKASAVLIFAQKDLKGKNIRRQRKRP
jgi:hypothetical protein